MAASGVGIPAPVAEELRFIDLFAGCGGFSLGFTAAGFRCIDGIELDSHAAATHAKHFHPSEGSSAARDIRDVLSAAYSNELVPDVIIGGPPCQPFTRVGRAKLRQVAEDARAHLHDERVTFYEHYLRFVNELSPLAFVMENVPDICRFAGRNIAEEIAVSAEALGYQVRYTLLNSAWYGVPQMRERVFIVGIRADLGIVPSFPLRTHHLELPRGYVTSRMEHAEPILPPFDHYCGKVEEVANPQRAVTAGDALSDLPPITEHLSHMQARKGARRFNVSLAYVSPPKNDYQRLMRTWPGMETTAPPGDHVIRYTPRDYETFRRMAPGDQYPAAFATALERFEEALRADGRRTGKRPQEGSARYQELKKLIVPPYDPTKFPNKWEKLDRGQPAHTLTAHLGKDSYSHIHYDSAQARMISVREAARLQSFPDAFRFSGTMNPAFKQIGNSVPPLLARAVAMRLKQLLGQAIAAKAGEAAKRKHKDRKGVPA